jgi:tetratricopeptide (TPR) repeat protein
MKSELESMKTFKIGECLLYELKHPEEALEAYQRASELNPRVATYYEKIGDIR